MLSETSQGFIPCKIPPRLCFIRPLVSPAKPPSRRSISRYHCLQLIRFSTCQPVCAAITSHELFSFLQSMEYLVDQTLGDLYNSRSRTSSHASFNENQLRDPNIIEPSLAQASQQRRPSARRHHTSPSHFAPVSCHLPSSVASQDSRAYFQSPLSHDILASNGPYSGSHSIPSREPRGSSQDPSQQPEPKSKRRPLAQHPNKMR